MPRNRPADAPTLAPDDPRHGTIAAYHGRARCDCQPCRDAATRYAKQRVYEAETGRPRLVSPLGFTRRIRALQRLGWTSTHIAAELGVTIGSLPLNRPQIRRETHQRMVDVYDKLSMKVGPSKRAATLAANKGWPPPLAWTDIDDPDDQPELVLEAGRHVWANKPTPHK